MKKKNNINYFKSRNLKINNMQTMSRDNLGENEVKNFEFLIEKLFKSNLTEKKILDVGSGDKFLKKSFEKRNYQYFDIDIDRVDLNTEKLPYNDNTFDYVICLAVIEHISNATFFINEISRVLKSDSVLFLCTPNWTYSYKNFYDDYTHTRPYTRKSLKSLLEDNNFTNINLLPGLRNKPFWMYKVSFAFYLASILPFTNDKKFLPNFLKGKASSIFAIAKKK